MAGAGMSEFPRTWALLGDKTGDNNQLLALAEALGWPFETRTLRYNLVRAIPPRNLGATLASLTRASRALIRAPWPDLILAIGRRSTPAILWIRERSPTTRLVLIGHPRVEPERFDLVITTRQYPVPPRDNVITLPLAMSRRRDPGVPTADERAFFDALPRPHLLFAIGGPTKYWELDERSVGCALDTAVARAEAAGGTLIAVRSRRTPEELIERATKRLAKSRHQLVLGGMPRFPMLMADADEIFVTADSVSMLSEAIHSGKPVGMVPLTMSPKGEKVLGGKELTGFGWGYGRRDLRRIWEQLSNDGLVGTVNQPLTGSLSRDSVEMAAAAVRKLMSNEKKNG
jgi:mitochondrial fission protein ELM1